MEEFELEPGEVIVQEVRQHLFVLALRIMPLLLLAIAPWIFGAIFSVASSAVPGTESSFAAFQNLAGHSRFLTGVWLLIIWTSIFSILTRFYLTTWIITNIRIVDIRQWSFFNREVSSFLLIRVQDMTTDVSGILATLIGFGKLHVETAGSDETFTMTSVKRPEHIRDVIMSQIAQLHHDEMLSGGV